MQTCLIGFVTIFLAVSELSLCRDSRKLDSTSDRHTQIVKTHNERSCTEKNTGKTRTLQCVMHFIESHAKQHQETNKTQKKDNRLPKDNEHFLWHILNHLQTKHKGKK